MEEEEIVTWDLWDASFAHCDYSNQPEPPVLKPRNLRWNRQPTAEATCPLFITDFVLGEHARAGNRRKIAWVVEPMSIQPHTYEWIQKNYQHFHAVVCHDFEALGHLPNYLFAPAGGAWLRPDRWWNGEESTLPPQGINLVASGKRITVGHNFRHDCVSAIRAAGKDVKMIGRGYEPFEFKHESLGVSHQVVIENSSRKGYFTDKIVDVLLGGVVPLFWGCPNFADYGFDEAGIIRFSSVEELMDDALPRAESGWRPPVEVLRHNAQVAGKDFRLAEDWIYDKYRDIL